MEREYTIVLDEPVRRRTRLPLVGAFATIGGFVCETMARFTALLGLDLPVGWLDGLWLGAAVGIAWAMTWR